MVKLPPVRKPTKTGAVSGKGYLRIEFLLAYPRHPKVHSW